jgi:hypothetical protein
MHLKTQRIAGVLRGVCELLHTTLATVRGPYYSGFRLTLSRTFIQFLFGGNADVPQDGTGVFRKVARKLFIDVHAATCVLSTETMVVRHSPFAGIAPSTRELQNRSSGVFGPEVRWVGLYRKRSGSWNRSAGGKPSAGSPDRCCADSRGVTSAVIVPAF